MFNAAMVAARNSETHPLMKAMAHAKAYVAYAQAHPGMYSLMFRNERLDMTRPSLHEAATAAFQGWRARSAPAQREAPGEALSLDQAAAIARAWSLVHGFTMLLLDGRLKDILRRLPAGTAPDQLLDAMLRLDGRPRPAGGELKLLSDSARASATPANLGLPRQTGVRFRVLVGAFLPVVILRLGVRRGGSSFSGPRMISRLRATLRLAGFLSSPGGDIFRRRLAQPVPGDRCSRRSASNSRCRRRSSRRGRCRRRAEP